MSFKQGHAIRRMTHGLCKAAGFAPADQLRGRRLQQRAGVRRGGVRGRIVPPEAAKYADVASLKITEPGRGAPSGVAWMKGRYLSASAKLFRDFATTAKSPSAPDTAKEGLAAHCQGFLARGADR